MAFERQERQAAEETEEDFFERVKQVIDEVFNKFIIGFKEEIKVIIKGEKEETDCELERVNEEIKKEEKGGEKVVIFKYQQMLADEEIEEKSTGVPMQIKVKDPLKKEEGKVAEILEYLNTKQLSSLETIYFIIQDQRRISTKRPYQKRVKGDNGKIFLVWKKNYEKAALKVKKKKKEGLKII